MLHGYDPALTPDELRDSARAWWVVDIQRARECVRLIAIGEGEIQGVWDIVPGSWRSTDGRRFGKSPIRWGCDVRDVHPTVRRQLLGSPPPLRADGRNLFGRGSVIAYTP